MAAAAGNHRFTGHAIHGGMDAGGEAAGRPTDYQGRQNGTIMFIGTYLTTSQDTASHRKIFRIVSAPVMISMVLARAAALSS